MWAVQVEVLPLATGFSTLAVGFTTSHRLFKEPYLNVIVIQTPRLKLPLNTTLSAERAPNLCVQKHDH